MKDKGKNLKIFNLIMNCKQIKFLMMNLQGIEQESNMRAIYNKKYNFF